MMPTFFVPIENHSAPEDQRWFFQEIDAPDAIDAVLETRAQWGQRRDFTVWAAVRECPTIEEMRAMRAGFDKTAAGKVALKRRTAA